MLSLIILFLALINCISSEYFSRNGLIVDSSGRARIFHGTNFVQKAYPWYPSTLLSVENVKQMADWGFNTVRLGVMWTGVNPEIGVFNETYIGIINQILHNLEEHGIHALIDVHQDVLSSHFCLYDGAPTWVVDLSNSTAHAFPWPLAWDGSEPCPSSRPWGQNYLAEATGAAFQDLYDNVNGMRDYFEAFWTKVAASFKHNNILGYEIINEPWAGNIYAQPSLLLPGVAGRNNLQPFYDHVAGAIRAEDGTHLVFYEPVTWGMIFNGSLTGSGFSHVPGGASFAEKSVFSFHYYCWWYGDGKDFNRQTCDRMFGPKVFDQVAQDVQALGGAAMLTEWGQGCQFSDSSSSTGECDPVMDLADERLMSWIDWYWSSQLVDEWRPAPEAIAIYSRTFARAVAGVPTFMRYEATSARFQLCYEVDPFIKDPTEIFVNNALHYPNGLDVLVSGSAAPSLTVTVGEAASNLVEVLYSPTQQQQTTGVLRACVLVIRRE